MKVRIGFDREVYGEIETRGDGSLAYKPRIPHYETALKQVAETYARQLELEDDATPESLARLTGDDILRRMLDRMQAKRLWAEEVRRA